MKTTATRSENLEPSTNLEDLSKNLKLIPQVVKVLVCHPKQQEKERKNAKRARLRRERKRHRVDLGCENQGPKFRVDSPLGQQ
jgi:hypothetical protein